MLLALAVLVRVAVVVMAVPDIDFRGGVNGEELLRGSAAMDFLRGPLLPWLDYQVTHFWGGSLLMGLLAAPLFALLGPTAPALRLTVLFPAALSIVSAFVLLDRVAGRRAAWIGGFLLALPPPGFLFDSVICMSVHIDASAFSLLLLCVHHWARGPRGGRAYAYSLVGLVAGFCVYVGYDTLVTIALLASLELLADKGFLLRRRFWAAAAGAVVGSSPWLAYNLQHGWAGLRVGGRDLTELVGAGAPGDALDKLVRLAVTDAPTAFWFRAPLADEGLWLGRLAALALFAAAAAGAWRARRDLRAAGAMLLRLRPAPHGVPPTVALIGAPASYLAAYLSADFPPDKMAWVVDYRYVMPLFALGVLPVALGLDGLAARSRAAARATGVSLALGLALFAAGSLLRCRPAHVREALGTPGYVEAGVVRFLILHHPGDRDVLGRFVARLESSRPEPVQRVVLERLSAIYRDRAQLGWDFGDGLSADEIRDLYAFLRDSVAPEHRELFPPL